MKTPSFEKSLKGFCIWFSWKIAFVIYILSTGLPVVGYIASLFVIAIKRKDTILISMIMMVMINPAITLANGVLSQTIGKLLSKKCPQLYKFKILARLFTYSINCHFAMIAGMTMYMYKMWIDLEKRAEFAFSDTSYAKCTCDVLTEYGHDCINRETDYSFQNLFLLVDMQSLLLSFFVTSIACHLIQSLFPCLPAPLPLYQFIVGQENKDERIAEETGSEFELEKLDCKSMAKSTKPKSHKGFATKGIKIASCIIAMAFFVGLVGVPFYGFDKLPGELISTKNGKTKK